MFVKIFQNSANKEIGKKSKLVEFWTQNLFQIHACMISMHTLEKHMYSHANMPLGPMRACIQYHLSYYSNKLICIIILQSIRYHPTSLSVIHANFTRICMESNKQNVAYIMPTISSNKLNFSKWKAITLFLSLSTLGTRDIFTVAAEWSSVGHRWTDLQPKPKAISGKAARKNLWCRVIPFTIPIELWSLLFYHIYFEPIRSNVSHCDHMDCRPPSCLLAVFAMFLAIISPSSSCSSYSWNEWSVRHFCFHNQNNSTSSPGLLG